MRAARIGNNEAQVEILLNAAEATWDDPWHDEKRVETGYSSIGPRPRVNGAFEGAMLKATACHSTNPLARTKAIWNLSCLASDNPRFAELAYRTFHGPRRGESTASATFARRLLRESIGRYRQDFGPVSAADGRLAEQAALKVVEVQRSTLYLGLLLFVRNRTHLQRDQAEEVLIEFLQDAVVRKNLSKGFATLKIDSPTALSYLKRMFKCWQIDCFRRELSASRLVEDFVENATFRTAEFDGARKRRTAAHILEEGLRQIPQDEAAAMFYYRVCEMSREEAADCLKITPTSLDQLITKAHQSMSANPFPAIDELS